MAGLAGCPIEISPSTDLEFETAELQFTYDDKKLGDTKEEDLRVMWYDEKNDKYVLLDDSVVDIKKNILTYKTTHFSTYLVVDRKQWNAVLEKNYNLFGNIIDYLNGMM